MQNNLSYQILHFLDLLHNDWSVLHYITSYNEFYNGFLKHWLNPLWLSMYLSDNLGIL